MSTKTAFRRMFIQGKRNLDDAIALLPTPTSRDHKGPSARKNRVLSDGSVSDDPCRNNQLPNAVMLLPTPTVADSRGTRNATSGRSNPDSAHHAGQTLTDVFWTGPDTNPPSDDGKPSSDGPHPPRLF